MFTELFTTWELADSFRAELKRAAQNGEAFDTESGMPDSQTRAQNAMTWYAHACDYVDARWPKVSGRQRISIAESLTAVTPLLVRDRRGAPDPRVLRSALYHWAFNKQHRDTDKSDDVAEALNWIAKASIPVTELAGYDRITSALDGCARKLDGTAASASYYSRRRRVLFNVLRYAVFKKRLAKNPLSEELDWKAPEAEVCEEINPSVVASPEQVQELLTAVSYAGWRRGDRLVAFFACMYYAMMHPSEVAALRLEDGTLPEKGWGQLLLSGSAPTVGSKWTDNGQAHEHRGLKGRPRKAKRIIPIPPQLVSILRDQTRRYGVAQDGRLFRTERGGTLYKSGYVRTWKTARALALPPALAASQLAKRPYDLRHAGVSLRLNAGVPATQVAQWAGHSVEVLLKIYAKCVQGQDQVWRRVLDSALGEAGTEADHDESKPENIT
ncbi:tyrosine-type recombinase/integrase [Nonomuraea aurantiaca]|uniref:tyrosine-type recombinase/integrase n=1 Tax=Nonomuraea aurantiaca TaxID=2878562 RepID=UPI001CDA325C|nr:tyrosine-type recombinase/integrase [Nonomuraea aurantiaca]MCA2229943.1 tyrosine-type recombinase/integrase [Nonomuraea aurantiaca]